MPLPLKCSEQTMLHSVRRSVRLSVCPSVSASRAQCFASDAVSLAQWISVFIDGVSKPVAA